ncbi:HD domain-containing protein [Thermococcus aciditolerans]|uniref:HD domain-containing protein n=1 Tax=Thermococcus aciditolerans TaxID=2598455 RepID=A0A5C0SH62_9EURY|nr:HD domain-containing protein [Thermococcus aciditolerans]QEK13905.1 HD domain-containing protein [Thermococcus aciditolerans]
MKLIHDPIHGHIELDDFVVGLVDTPEFQRLRRITQLGLAFLAYPSARHTRFEHSLGTFYLAKRIVEHNPEIGEGAVYAALLHDLGHYPFSHTLEALYPRHEENTKWFIRHGEIGDVIRERYSVGEFLKLLKHPLVSGDIDADRMDYLVRDAYYTGAAYGLVDLDRLVRNLLWRDGMLIVGEKGVIAAQNLLLARSMMYPTVYQHHVSKIASAMLVTAVELEGIPSEEIRTMDEVDLIARLRASERAEVRELVRAIDDRRLYKRVLYSASDPGGDAVAELWGELEAEFGHLAIVDYPPKPKFEEKNAFVETERGLKRLSEVSPLVRSLVELKDTHWRWGVYARADVRERVERFLGAFFD